jgi:hypothetical protein
LRDSERDKHCPPGNVHQTKAVRSESGDVGSVMTRPLGYGDENIRWHASRLPSVLPVME